MRVKREGSIEVTEFDSETAPKPTLVGSVEKVLKITLPCPKQGSWKYEKNAKKLRMYKTWPRSKSEPVKVWLYYEIEKSRDLYTPSGRWRGGPFFDKEELLSTGFWLYKGALYSAQPTDLTSEEIRLLIEEYLIKRDKRFGQIRRLLDLADEFQKGFSREPIPEDVQMFVWRRDKGECVKCGSQEDLEFDHVIPVSKGGANSARNLQLLCQVCNRSKGASI